MAYHHLDVTLGASPAKVISTHTPVRLYVIFNTSGNGTLSVGDKNLSATSFGYTIAGGALGPIIGPFAGELPFNLDEVFVSGTNAQVIHITYVT